MDDGTCGAVRRVSGSALAMDRRQRAKTMPDPLDVAVSGVLRLHHSLNDTAVWACRSRFAHSWSAGLIQPPSSFPPMERSVAAVGLAGVRTWIHIFSASCRDALTAPVNSIPPSSLSRWNDACRRRGVVN